MTAARSSARRALLVGLGRSGISCARFLAARGWELAATDSREAPPGLEALRALAPAARASVGRFDTALLDGVSLVVSSPGVSPAEPILAQAIARGLDVVGDIELFARVVAAPVVGITGTNGKSTVTTLLGRMAERAGIRVRVGGNLGTPALDLLANTEPDLYVLEISSFQLETTRSLRCVAATVLNLSADHMDRYASLEEYGAAKARIFTHCGTAVVNEDDPMVRRMPRPGQRVVGFSVAAAAADYRLERHAGEDWLVCRGEPLLPLSALRIPGLHNAANALAALALGEACGLPIEPMRAALREFPGLPHRSQWVADVRGVRYIDDSKGTNVGATVAALDGLRGPLVLVAGGDGKGQDFAPLAAACRGRVRAAVLIGRDAPRLAEALAGVCALERCDSLEQAVATAARLAEPGDTVLLSPACASLDMFRDYAHRGEVFAAAVRSLPA